MSQRAASYTGAMIFRIAIYLRTRVRGVDHLRSGPLHARPAAPGRAGAPRCWLVGARRSAPALGRMAGGVARDRPRRHGLVPARAFRPAGPAPHAAGPP